MRWRRGEGEWYTPPHGPRVKEGFFCYGFLWGINHGLIDKKTYLPVAKKAWAALNLSVHENGMLGYIQPIGAAPDKVDENSTEIYGVGAFLLAGSELYKMKLK